MKNTQSKEIIAKFSGSLDQFDLSVDVTLPARGVTALFGRSGCGKTTVLRCLAGLSRVDRGYLSVKGKVWQDGNYFLPTPKRPVGFVFQEASLFPHLSVDENLTFGQRRAGDRANIISRDDLVELLGLGALMNRSTHHLSGGERQRVAIGRALLSGPELLLMDEPLAALDRLSKNEIIPYLDRLFKTLDIPMIFVSHDTEEVERLADHMVIMDRGKIVSNGLLSDVLSDPALFIAEGPKTSSVIEVEVVSFSEVDKITEVRVEGGRLQIPGQLSDVGSKQRISIAANDVSLAKEQPSETTILNVLPARILDIHLLDGARCNLLLSIGHQNEDGARFLARITQRSLRKFDFAIGHNIYAQVKSVSMVGAKI
ncbi:molybdenum ABC transporter ATP-binding protein [Kiloniella spongiae]|uniref:Molybdenum ABC transporter ATP-binding protein n=1 Tax=Kiloniella spongiae TaxID=1489064 RepID=A0A0H2MV21_9PROT|nr:molybdenum ABC transporter ATP-binding protein [Kiloniella spongiae]KLN60540.1 molybdenum ABC transporter ATP-binding protein [Kiloniella spongiae]